MSSLNPLAEITTYQAMLRRIAFFTFITAIIGILLLRAYLPAFDQHLAALGFDVTIPGVNKTLPGGTVVAAFVVAVVNWVSWTTRRVV